MIILIFTSVGGKGGIPDHRDMAIFQLADKFTLTKTDTSRLAVWLFLIVFHAGASRNLILQEGRRQFEAMKTVGRYTE